MDRLFLENSTIQLSKRKIFNTDESVNILILIRWIFAGNFFYPSTLMSYRYIFGVISHVREIYSSSTVMELICRLVLIRNLRSYAILLFVLQYYNATEFMCSFALIETVCSHGILPFCLKIASYLCRFLVTKLHCN